MRLVNRDSCNNELLDLYPEILGLYKAYWEKNWTELEKDLGLFFLINLLTQQLYPRKLL